MIETKGRLIGDITSRLIIEGAVNKATEYIDPITQEKQITPTEEIQEVIPDKGYTGLNKVIVDKIPEEYIIPSGDLEIDQNGSYDVRDKANAVVSVQPSLQEKSTVVIQNGNLNVVADNEYYGLSKVSITTNVPEKKLGTKEIIVNGKYNATDDDLDGYSSVNVKIPEKQFGTKTITQNGAYKATDDNLDGYSEVNVETSGVDINEYFTSTISDGVTNWKYMIKKMPTISCSANVINLYSHFGSTHFTELTFDNFNSQNVVNMSEMFNGCQKLKTLDLTSFNTAKVANMEKMFYNCSALTSLDLSSFNTQNVTNMTYMFNGCSNLTNLNISNFDFTKVTSYNNIFNLVPADCYILVKDDTAKEWITSKFTTLTNVHYVGEE